MVEAPERVEAVLLRAAVEEEDKVREGPPAVDVVEVEGVRRERFMALVYCGCDGEL